MAKRAANPKVLDLEEFFGQMDRPVVKIHTDGPEYPLRNIEELDTEDYLVLTRAQNAQTSLRDVDWDNIEEAQVKTTFEKLKGALLEMIEVLSPDLAKHLKAQGAPIGLLMRIIDFYFEATQEAEGEADPNATSP